jgi:hypothetical protein
MHLDKALYGIRQLPRAWNSKIDETLAMIGFSHNTSEHTVYTRGESASWLLVGVYVNDANKIATFKQQMSDRFKMSDLGLLSFYLGIEVKQGSDGITLSQAAYAWKILECAGMGSSNPCHTPMEHRLNMSKQSTAPEVNATEYRGLIVCLRYLVHTRLDITFTVGYVSRFMECPTMEHFNAVKRVLH